MLPRPIHWRKFLIGMVLISFIIEDSLGRHHHHHKDDDDSDEDGCYPGRNCRPGCYCTGGYCRPYFPPHSDYLKRYQCTGYNYPKYPKTGSKGDGGNSTLVSVRPDHYEKSAVNNSTFSQENNFTTQETHKLPVPAPSPFPKEPQLLSIKPSSSKLDNLYKTSTVINLVHATSSSTVSPS